MKIIDRVSLKHRQYPFQGDISGLRTRSLHETRINKKAVFYQADGRYYIAHLVEGRTVKQQMFHRELDARLEWWEVKKEYNFAPLRPEVVK